MQITINRFFLLDIVRRARRKREQARHSGRERFIIGRKKVTGFREKPVLSFYSQPFLYGKLCPGGRAPQFIFSPQLGSCGHVVQGVSWLGGHVVLRNWHQQGKTGYRLKEKTGCPPKQCGHCDFTPCLSGHHNGRFLTTWYKPLVNPNRNDQWHIRKLCRT